MSYELCPICEKAKATPIHVTRMHGMSWQEFKAMIEDPDFMADVAKHKEERQEREEKEYHRSRILLYYWYPRTSTLTGVMRRYTEHAKGSADAFYGKNKELDLSEYDNKREVSVSDITISEALQKEGWECTGASGGWDGSPKQYHLRRIEVT